MMAAVITGFMVTVIKNDEIAAFTASNTRLQILLSTIFSFFFIIIMLALVPEEFSFGVDSFPVLYKEGLSGAKFMSCGLLGLLLNIIVLGLFEIITSHGFDSVRDLTRAADSAPTLNVISAYGNSFR